MNALRTIYRWWAAILVVGILLQIAFAGYGAFYSADKVSSGALDEDTFDDGWGLHTGVGYLVLLGSLLLLVLALLARPGRRKVFLSLGLFGLVIVQVILAWIGEEVPVVGMLHPLNAFAILGLAGSIAATEWRARRMGVETVAPAATPPPATPPA